MCELFGLSCNQKDRATLSLPVFQDYSRLNRDGWGIAYYLGNQAIIKKRPEKASSDLEFQIIVSEAKSNIIISHLRNATNGEVCHENCHPFKLNYHERDWVFAHNGMIDIDYNAVEGNTDSARAFQFIMDKIDAYVGESNLHGLYIAVKKATQKLIEQHRGTVNYLLSDGNLLYAFSHYPGKPMYFLRREKAYGGAVLVSTQKLSDENWKKIPPDKLLVVNNGEILVLSKGLE